MKTVYVQYYAALREQRGLSSETLQTAAETPRSLYSELSGTHAFSLAHDRLKVIVNENFVEWDSPLNHRDTVVFVPPVAGG